MNNDGPVLVAVASETLATSIADAVRQALGLPALAAVGLLDAVDGGLFAGAIVEDGWSGQDIGSLCRALRSAGLTAPLVALAEATPPGADAIVARPVRIAAVVAALDRLRREPRPVPPRLVGGRRFDPQRRRLIDDAGTEIVLTAKETAILDRLLKAGDAVVTRDRLLDEVWGYVAGVATHTLETHIYRLRRKIGDQAAILTERGGYRLVP
jgi:DNA-binding response OmpR family regulator